MQKSKRGEMISMPGSINSNFKLKTKLKTSNHGSKVQILPLAPQAVLIKHKELEASTSWNVGSQTYSKNLKTF